MCIEFEVYSFSRYKFMAFVTIQQTRLPVGVACSGFKKMKSLAGAGHDGCGIILATGRLAQTL